MHTILFLANGSQTRFGPADVPKQLVTILGRPLLVDTIGKFKDHVTSITVVTSNPVIMDAVQSVARVVSLGPTRGLQDTMLQSRSHWGINRTTFLFGDCFYSWAATRAILDCVGPYGHFGRTHESSFTGKPYGESFALTWTHTMDEYVARVLAEKPEGTSWEFYKRMAGLGSIPESENYLEKSPECLTRIDDFTEDFDSLVDYERWLALIQIQMQYDEDQHRLTTKYAADRQAVLEAFKCPTL